MGGKNLTRTLKGIETGWNPCQGCPLSLAGRNPTRTLKGTPHPRSALFSSAINGWEVVICAFGTSTAARWHADRGISKNPNRTTGHGSRENLTRTLKGTPHPRSALFSSAIYGRGGGELHPGVLLNSPAVRRSRILKTRHSSPITDHRLEP